MFVSFRSCPGDSRDGNAWARARMFSDAAFSRPRPGIDWKAAALEGMIDAAAIAILFLAPHCTMTSHRPIEPLEPRQYRAAIAGLVWNDLNGSGVLDEDESPIKSATVFIDANHNA